MKIIKPSYEILTDIDPKKIMANIERAGRTCYKSEDKIKTEWVKIGKNLQKFSTGDVHYIPALSKKNTSAEPFIRGIIKSGHHSVLEHESISVRFICDRGVSHELVRHRLASFSQESTRYCNYSVDGLTFIRPLFWDENSEEYYQWAYAMKVASQTYMRLLQLGARPEQARAVLPNSLKTEIVMTANIRGWRHVFTLRCTKAAHPQMREIMMPLLEELAIKLPVLFGDVFRDILDNIVEKHYASNIENM
ncbi:FAD-dependent thymidylate synthase [Patescibacteria group bacterium]|nr:FAD-dependent thymidylate synthase [Patescibacteria group bacterium]